METVADVFQALGGTAAMARILKVGASTASEMKRRGRIPAEYWYELISSARKLGVQGLDAEALVRIHARAHGSAGPGDGDRHGARSAAQELGHFTRFKHLRRDRFRSLQEINDHVAALREEWDRR